MLFLIEYDRTVGRIVAINRFKDWERQKADDARLEIEVSLNQRGVEHEVVILEAMTEEALRRTHRRYFEDISELTTAPAH
jgi:hypothetical protein